MIAAILGVGVVLAEAGGLSLALYLRTGRYDETPVYANTYDPDAEARTVILPAVDLDGVDRVRPYVKHLPPWIEPSRDLDPRLRRELIRRYTVAQMLSVNRQWQQLALEGGVR